MSKKILLSFDVEEFDIPCEFGYPVSPEVQMQTGAEGFRKILGLLDQVDVRATLFTTAAFAERWPELIQRAAKKHEIASHGFYHSKFEEADLAKSREVLSSVSGQNVIGFRRARFGRTDTRAILAAGYQYDSSENPIWLPGRYNNFFKPRTVYVKEGLRELPVSASPLLRIPLFWLAFKNYPLSFFKAVSAWTLANDGYLNIFFHPWEFCHLQEYGLPGYVRKIDGELLLERLDKYLHFLKMRGNFQTLKDFLKELS